MLNNHVLSLANVNSKIKNTKYKNIEETQ